MSLSLCILASGSSGNCCLVRGPGGVLMIDCGIGPRVAKDRLRGTGVNLAEVSAICLTHLDSDHFNINWVGTILHHGIRVFCHAARVDALRAMAGDPRFADRIEPFDDRLQPVEGISVEAIPLAHDQAGSHGFVIEGAGTRLGYATDLGRVPGDLIEGFCGVDLLAIESNYDPQMQIDSGRPPFLQRRITGGRGHLSNEQSFEAVRSVLDRAQRQGRRLPEHIVLLHRSRHCNSPRLVRELFACDARIAPRLTLAEQHQRTEWLAAAETRAGIGEQLLLKWG